MQKINLYKYTRSYGGTTVSPIQPDVPYATMVRLIADEGKQLTKNNIDFYECADGESDEGWIEVEPEDTSPISNEEAQYTQELEKALGIIGVEVN